MTKGDYLDDKVREYCNSVKELKSQIELNEEVQGSRAGTVDTRRSGSRLGFYQKCGRHLPALVCAMLMMPLAYFGFAAYYSKTASGDPERGGVRAGKEVNPASRSAGDESRCADQAVHVSPVSHELPDTTLNIPDNAGYKKKGSRRQGLTIPGKYWKGIKLSDGKVIPASELGGYRVFDAEKYRNSRRRYRGRGGL